MSFYSTEELIKLERTLKHKVKGGMDIAESK